LSLLSTVALVLLGYLLGSVPTGYLAGRIAGVDVRKVGSKRTGATNTFRVLGWRGFALVLLADLIKGAAPILVARMIGVGPEVETLTGLAAVIGHNWSVYIKFTGGRGVATGLGVLLIMSPITVAIAAAIAVMVVGTTRYVSLASVTGAAVLPVVMLALVFYTGTPLAYFLYAAAAGALIIIQHKDNIHRLLSGTERKFGTDTGAT
jgi:acyl phosphate:glycerol-3-phosphate acyltransferase